MFPYGRTRRVGDDVGVANRRISLGHDKADVKGRLVRRLIETGEGPARVGGLKLRHGVAAAGRPGKVEAT